MDLKEDSNEDKSLVADSAKMSVLKNNNSNAQQA